MADWKGFERLAERIARDVAPHATVSRNDHIDGHLSEKKRQVDVSIRWSDTGHDYLTIVQAKDWRSPADINTVGEFAAVVEDVRATRGVLVCRSGRGARSVHRPAGNNLIQVDSTFERLWNTEAIPQTIGMLHTVTLSEPIFMLMQDTGGIRQWRRASLELVYEVDCRAWLGSSPSQARRLGMPVSPSRRARAASCAACSSTCRTSPAMRSTTNKNIEMVPNGPKRAGRRRRSPVRLVEVAGRAVTDRRPLPLGPG
jgi:hypothetical protein